MKQLTNRSQTLFLVVNWRGWALGPSVSWEDGFVASLSLGPLHLSYDRSH